MNMYANQICPYGVRIPENNMLTVQTTVRIYCILFLNVCVPQVAINSAGLEYSAISLLSTLFMMYATFYFNKFRLDKRVGRVCLCMYAVFLVLATLIELNVLFEVNLPTCGR